MDTKYHDKVFSTYSDVYKDVHGFRPRGGRMLSWTTEQLEVELDKLQDQLDEIIEEELTGDPTEPMENWLLAGE